MEDFSFQTRNSVECAVNGQCAIVERTAFVDGVRVGAKPVMALIE